MNQTRTLPTFILDAANDPANPEPKAVVEKFRHTDAAIGETNIDYVALGYMTPGAALFWLPAFMNYIRLSADPDSFHLESMITKLADSGWVSSVRLEATAEEIGAVAAFLDWLKSQPIMDRAPPLRAAAYAYAVELWK
jgi:hypothetical protein